MGELFHTLGINIKSLGFQILNFAILVIVLRFTAYKPLLKLMKARRERIEFGLKGAEEADKRLAEIDQVKEQKLKEADEKAEIANINKWTDAAYLLGSPNLRIFAGWAPKERHAELWPKVVSSIKECAIIPKSRIMTSFPFCEPTNSLYFIYFFVVFHEKFIKTHLIVFLIHTHMCGSIIIYLRPCSLIG